MKFFSYCLHRGRLSCKIGGKKAAAPKLGWVLSAGRFSKFMLAVTLGIFSFAQESEVFALLFY